MAPAFCASSQTHRNMTNTRTISRAESRRGTLAPAIAFALLAVMGLVALVLDSLWLDTAQAELQVAAEAAALAAGVQLASDDLLRGDDPDATVEQRLALAREAARRVAQENRIAGRPVQLDVSPDGDIRFGKLVRREETGEAVFIETRHDVRSVAIRAEHSRSRNNPVAIWLLKVTSQPGGDVAAIAEATLDNHLVGLEALNGIPVPALPLAVLNHDPEGKRENWRTQIEQRRGPDRFSVDERTGEVAPSSSGDGIPELTVRSAPHRGDATRVNLFLFLIRPGLTESDLKQQFRLGFTRTDLPRPLRFDQGMLRFETTPTITGCIPAELRELIGQCRIVFLYDEHRDDDGIGMVRIVAPVAARILNVELHDDGSCELVLQPGVMTTRTALTTSPSAQPGNPSTEPGTSPDQNNDSVPNPYIYRLLLTN